MPYLHPHYAIAATPTPSVACCAQSSDASAAQVERAVKAAFKGVVQTKQYGIDAAADAVEVSGGKGAQPWNYILLSVVG